MQFFLKYLLTYYKKYGKLFVTLMTQSYDLATSAATATAVTLKTNVICLNIHSNRKSVSHGFLATIFRTLDKHGIVVDLISTSEV
jgi:aspartate kinase